MLTLRASLPTVRIPPPRVPMMIVPRVFRRLILPVLAGLLVCVSALAVIAALERWVRNTCARTRDDDEATHRVGHSFAWGALDVKSGHAP